MCARQTIERRGSQFAQDRKRSSQDQQHGWSKENVRKVSSLQSVVSCGSYLFLAADVAPLLVHFPLSHPLTLKKKKKKIEKKKEKLLFPNFFFLSIPSLLL